MIALWAAVAASAGQWGDPRPYALPILNVNAYSVNGNTNVQVSGGVEGGVRIRYKSQPKWLSHSRARLVGTYGLLSGGLGADVRVGSFIGPDWKMFRYQVGPDVWYNGYGDVDTSLNDFWLPWAPGVDVSNVATLKLIKEFHIIGEATPAFVFHPDRQSPDVEPFSELTLALAAVIRTQPIRLTVGYVRKYQAFGVYEGLILSGAL